MTAMPRVSILINNHNYARYLGDAIESALDQSYPHLEVIVVDDGSTDSSWQVVTRYTKRVNAIRKPRGGQASALNAAFSASQGDIVCLLDSDDLFIPNKVAQVVQLFSERPEIGWYFDPVQPFHSSSSAANHPVNRTSHIRPMFGLWDARAKLIAGCPPDVPTATSGLSFSRTLLAQILPMPEIPPLSDHYLKFVALALSTGWMNHEPLTRQRLHNMNSYTGAANRNRLGADIQFVTGTALLQHWPQLRRLGVRLVAQALASGPGKGPFLLERRKATIRLLLTQPPTVAYSLLARAGYELLRSAISSSRQAE